MRTVIFFVGCYIGDCINPKFHEPYDVIIAGVLILLLAIIMDVISFIHKMCK